MNNFGQPYFMNPGVQPYGFQPMFSNGPQNPQAQMPKNQPLEQYVAPQQPQQVYKQPIYLQGKSVDSVEVVKATDIPLDGSVSYFPLTDGSAIVTKQLQQDGTSKTIIYKPISPEEEKKDATKYVTPEELQKAIKGIDLSELETLREDFDDFRKEIKDIRTKLKNKGE